VPFGCVAAARHRRPDVAERGTASGGNAAVEGGVGRCVEQDKGGADLQGLGRRPAAEITRAADSRGDRGHKEDDGGPRRNITEMQGPYCNARVTFKPGLKMVMDPKAKMYGFSKCTTLL
jgi:hypothetical protein